MPPLFLLQHHLLSHTFFFPARYLPAKLTIPLSFFKGFPPVLLDLGFGDHGTTFLLRLLLCLKDRNPVLWVFCFNPRGSCTIATGIDTTSFTPSPPSHAYGGHRTSVKGGPPFSWSSSPLRATSRTSLLDFFGLICYTVATILLPSTRGVALPGDSISLDWSSLHLRWAQFFYQISLLALRCRGLFGLCLLLQSSAVTWATFTGFAHCYSPHLQIFCAGLSFLGPDTAVTTVGIFFSIYNMFEHFHFYIMASSTDSPKIPSSRASSSAASISNMASSGSIHIGKITTVLLNETNHFQWFTPPEYFLMPNNCLTILMALSHQPRLILHVALGKLIILWYSHGYFTPWKIM